MRCHRLRSRVALGIFLLVAGTSPAWSGGIAIVETVLSDNGDDDGFADTRETVSLRLLVRNTSGIPLTGVTAEVATPHASLACLTEPSIDIGNLGVGEERLTDEAFVFTVSGVDRDLLGLSVYDDLSIELGVQFKAEPLNPRADPPTLTLDLDLDVSGGDGPTSFFESFEEEHLGSFEVENLDQDLNSLEAADGYRCQDRDPDWVNSIVFQYPDPVVEDTCFPGSSQLHADKVFWGESGPGHSPMGGRGFSGFHSLFFGIDFGPPKNWTTPLGVLEAVATTEPIALGWETPPVFSFKHQVRLVENWYFNPGHALDRAVVMVQVADDAGNPAGPWIKVDPYQNAYDTPTIDWDPPGCIFDPIDDGSTEDDFFDPADPGRLYGPSSTCFPERTFTLSGETSSAFDPENTGHAEGPGLQGMWGIGTWVESKIDLGRFRGRQIRLRFLATAIKSVLNHEDWEELEEWNPIPDDDGWWIDDVTITGALETRADVTADGKDNSALPGLAWEDLDTDGINDICDNCPGLTNPTQLDQDFDGEGDACDPCPTHADVTDVDGDGFCGADDNCPFVANPDQTDGDGDRAGLACDCNDADGTIFPGADEINDGIDNQCPGDEGYGVVDETSGTSGFLNPNDENEYSWPAQEGAQTYQVARAETPDFATGCILIPLFPTDLTLIVDTAVPNPGTVFYYLNHAVAPNVGSWGQTSDPVERLFDCN